MRGAALKDGEFVDIQKLFQYAADEVPKLAKNIGGIQRPVVAAPQGTSFDVGQLKDEDRMLVPFEAVKPMVLRPLLINPTEFADNLGLTDALRKMLRESGYSTGRGETVMVFIDEDKFPDAIQPSGTYFVEGELVKLKLVLRRNNETIATLREIAHPKSDIEGLLKEIMLSVKETIVKSE